MSRYGFTSLILLVSASIASAHGVQTQLTYDVANNKVDTRSIIYTSSNPIGQPNPITYVSEQRRAYIMPLEFSPIGAGTGWYARPAPFLNLAGHPVFPTGPGPAWQYEDGTPTASYSPVAGTGWSYTDSATLPNLQGSAFTYKLLDGLKHWNGSSFVDPGTEQLQILTGDATTPFTATATNNVITSDTGPFGSLTLAAISSRSSSNNGHGSLSFRLLGDGTTLVDGDDGIYLLKLAIGTSATIGTIGQSVGDSDPFYFVFTKNASYADAFAATQSLGITPALIQGQVPEPATLAAIASLSLIARRSRR